MAQEKNSNKEIKDIFDLLRSGNEKIKPPKHKDIVLILGNTGAGKSTLTKFITKNHDLYSEETSPDSGEYIIFDQQNKISTSTILSKTIYPDQIIDKETETILYDCPGFSDTRRAAHDISATYFVKKIIDFSRSVKLVFVVNYPSVRKGVDRQDFIRLVRHAITFLKEVEKYRESIALIVTKVDNQYIRRRGEFILVPDEVIIASIADFLRIVKKDIFNIYNSSISQEDRHFHEKALPFIDALLETNGKYYKKIGIFRRPDKSGPLSEILLMQEVKRSLGKIIHNNIYYVKRDENDFGYTISAESQNYIHDLSDEINKGIATEIGILGKEIEHYIHNEEVDTQDIFALHNLFKTAISMLTKLETKNEKGFIKDTIKTFNVLDVNMPTDNLLNIINYYNYLQFLKSVSDKSTTNPLKWSQGLVPINEYLTKSERWYNFLINLQNWLSEYNVQQNVSQFDQQIVSNLIEQCSKDMINIKNSDVKELLNKVAIPEQRHSMDTIYNDVKDMVIGKVKAKALRIVLDLTLNYKTESLCKTGNNLIIKAPYVKLSDIDIMAKNCSQTVKFIEILASNKIFIDTDLFKIGDKLQLAIISPIWDIVGERNIVLDGKTGEHQHKADDGRFPGNGGIDGKPGLPGGSAGNFFGIAGRVIGGQLNVSANGGRGGTGQEGGDGAVGKRGDDAPYGRDNAWRTILNEWGPSEDWDKAGVKWQLEDKTNYVFVAWYDYKAKGTKATNGGQGGNGGVGGRGGHKGNIKIIELNPSNKIRMITNEGSDGDGGKGGDGGPSAENGYSRYANCKVRRIILFTYTTCDNEKREPAGYSHGGNPGKNGENWLGREAPEKATEFVNLSHIINNFKNYLRECLVNSNRNTFLMEFQNRMDNTDTITNLYDILGLVNELQGLENQFYNLNKHIPLLPFYKLMLDRIDKYALKQNSSREKSPYYNRVLSYLYTATLSKISSIKNDKQNYLILDIPKFFDLAIDSIAKLKELNRNGAINYYKTNYIEKIDEQINNNKYILQKMVVPEINKQFHEIDEKIELLINETLGMINVTKDEEYILNKRQQDLEQSMLIRMFLSPLKLIKEFVSFIAPVGEELVDIIKLGNFVADVFRLSKPEGNSDTPQTFSESLVTQLGIALTTITDLAKDHQSLLSEQLSDINYIFNENLGEELSGKRGLSAILEEIQATKGGLEETGEDNLRDPSSIQGIRHKLVKLFQDQVFPQTPDGNQSLGGMEIVNRSLQILNLTVPSDIYKKIRNDPAKIHLISDTIESLKVKRVKLQQFETNIYNIVIPKCKELYFAVKTFSSKESLSNPGHPRGELVMSHWKIHATIKALKFEIQQLSDFGLEENLNHCLEKLDEAMSYVNSIYNSLDDYHDTAVLAAYIADISSVSGLEIGMYNSNKELDNAINYLSLLIQSNLVLGQYKRAINAFTQYIFPFASAYLEQYHLPVSLTNDTDPMINQAIEKIKSLKLKIVESSISLGEYDKYIHKNVEFSSDSKISPFFVWKNDLNKNTIIKLLSGEEVTLKPDIRKMTNKNAVKFNIIGIKLKAVNETIQKKLNDDLQNFELVMTHFGNSYFKCDNRYYVMPGRNLTFKRHWKNNQEGDPIYANEVYHKIKNNDFILSPFALWTIKLINETNNFKPIEKYKNEIIDLELEGRGQYISSDEDSLASVCDKTLADYYTLDDSISDLGKITDKLLDQLDAPNEISFQLQALKQKARSRKRRTITQSYSNEAFEISSAAKSGAVATSKSSFINNVFQTIFTGATFLNMNPISHISEWIKLNCNSQLKIINSFSNQMIDNPSMQDEFFSTGKISATTIYNNLLTQKNLLLWDILIRKFCHSKFGGYHLDPNKMNHMKSNKFSHNLAYRYYSQSNKNHLEST